MDDIYKLKQDRNNILASVKSLLRAIENGDLIIYPKENNTFDYIQHLEDTIIKINYNFIQDKVLNNGLTNNKV